MQIVFASVRCVALLLLLPSTGRQPGNCKILAFYGTEYEAFQRAAGQMMERFRGCIPEGSDRARIRCTRRETRDPASAGAGVLADTLGEETADVAIVRVADRVIML